MTDRRSRPHPLGATLHSNGCNFSIHAPHCQEISLVLFTNDNEYQEFPLINEYAGIRHIYIPNVDAGQKYGYAIVTEEGESLLISDPYAKALEKPLHYATPYSSKKVGL